MGNANAILPSMAFWSIGALQNIKFQAPNLGFQVSGVIKLPDVRFQVSGKKKKLNTEISILDSRF